jgi:hypothetical protein
MGLLASARPRISAGPGDVGKGLLGLFAASGVVVALSLSASAASPSAPSSTSCSTTGSSGEPEIFYVGGVVPSGGATPQCAIIQPASGVIHPGDTIGAIYSDETTINTSPSFPTAFSIDGVAQPFTVTNIVPPQGQDFQSSVTITVPANLAPGLHTAKVQAWDSDQTEGGGGDFGEVIFTFDVATPSTPTPTPTPTSGGAVLGITSAPATGALGQDTLIESLALVTAGGTLLGLVARRRRRAS